MEPELPEDINTWTREHVRGWLLRDLALGEATAQILYRAEYRGDMLPLLDEASLRELGVSHGPARLIMKRIGEFSAARQKAPGMWRHRDEKCLPYPFNCFHDGCRYVLNRQLLVPETGPLNLTEPCHEFKALQGGTHKEKLIKFTQESVRFAAACLNTRSNGTIHFGVLDDPHGKIVGVSTLRRKEENSYKAHVKENQEEDYIRERETFSEYFEAEFRQGAMKCIKAPRFVEVLNPDCNEDNTFVIEVDVEPRYTWCREDLYYTIETLTNKKTKKHNSAKRHLYIRQGSSTFDLMATDRERGIPKHNIYSTKTIKEIAELRKTAEKEHKRGIQNSVQGLQLKEAITNGSDSLDKSHFEWYILVTNKSHPVQLESVQFLTKLELFAVLDFDPESKSEGLHRFFQQDRRTNTHFPEDYTSFDAADEAVRNLELSKVVSWVFCNGSSADRVAASVPAAWHKEKGAAVHGAISFLCRRDIMPRGRFLVVFLLLSRVDDQMDPLLEAFSAFYQELRGTESLLSICNSESTFTSWKDLISAKFSEQITERCIFKLSLAEVNGTILSLAHSSERFLPCRNAANITLKKKDEEDMQALSILCANQCEGQHEDKDNVQRSFYRGGEATWWNFHLSSKSVIRRDKHEYVTKSIRLKTSEPKNEACITFNLFHHPGCGGTTLAKHALWSLKKEFRCVVLKDSTVGCREVARQVITLLKYGMKENLVASLLPVLILIDNFEEVNVASLQDAIREEIKLEDLTNGDTLVVLLNCVRSHTQPKSSGSSDAVFLGNRLSSNEKELFERRLKEIEMDQKEVETFYGFMIMKHSFDPQYVSRVVRNNLQHFNFSERKEAKLFGALALLHIFAQGSALSVSLCEKFLGLEGQPRCGYLRVEEEFGQFSKLVIRCTVEEGEKYQAVRIIHRSVSERTLEELMHTHGVNKRDIVHLLLHEDTFHDRLQGKKKLEDDIVGMLCSRQLTQNGSVSRFSPLVQAVMRETPGAVEDLLNKASERFESNAFISQLQALFYIESKNSSEALKWAKIAKKKDKKNVDIANTLAQAYKCKLLAIPDLATLPVAPAENFREYLKLACCSLSEFRIAQSLLKKEVIKTKSDPHSSVESTTSCFLGEISVCDIILNLLQRIPQFEQNGGGQNLVGYLSGDITIDELQTNNKQHSSYLAALKDWDQNLHNLKAAMKEKIDFLKCYLSNFEVPNLPFKMQTELESCFRTYSEVFCRPICEAMEQSEQVQVEEKRKALERMKADTSSGILAYLNNEHGHTDMKTIVQSYRFTLEKSDGCLRDELHLILASIVLYCTSPFSRCADAAAQKEEKLKSDLKKATKKSVQAAVDDEENILLHFLTTLLCWETRAFSERVETEGRHFLDRFRVMRHSLSPVPHFYFGSRAGLWGLLSRKEAERHLGGQADCNADLMVFSGITTENGILCDNDRCISVSPTSAIGQERNSRVKFFVGLTMAGPLAFGIRHCGP
ncbi:hypothetical protein AAFF_G00271760 [Aldrovandia affinis]|uniref:SAM domain-containing protein n=1 Tax=Aldrovandia affinis TaxID=143900 RepID=A0AAD7RAR9_9TELE|nr:hypothetical protein AAFF_G00271760 [Aldrovandia affinis]